MPTRGATAGGIRATSGRSANPGSQARLAIATTTATVSPAADSSGPARA